MSCGCSRSLVSFIFCSFRGFGFVQFADEESALNAINTKFVEFDGMRLYIKASSNNVPGSNKGGPQKSPQVTPDKGQGGPTINRPGAPMGQQNNFGMPNNKNSIFPANVANQQMLPDEVSQGTDCEIIVCTKMQTSYAESIEMQLTRVGLNVDLLFPNGVVSIGKILGNISARGCLYAILVTPQNEEHRSITVNVLYGQPAEHRNMPVEDAIRFIIKDFKENARKKPTQMAPPLKDRHPPAVQNLLNMLNDNGMLTVAQYTTVIQYLQERRDLQTKVEIGDDVSLMRKEDGSVVKAKTEEEQLQEKIMSILSKPSISENILNLKTGPEEEDENDDGMGILKDPKVQKALDSLLLSCITFKF